MHSEILASDPLTKIKTIFHPTHDDKGTFHLEEVQDAEDIVDVNRRLYNDVDERARHGTMNRYASIPLVLFFDLWKKGMFRGAKLSKDDKRWLNDRDNLYFRTRPGRL
jgi:hypothetical protein